MRWFIALAILLTFSSCSTLKSVTSPAPSQAVNPIFPAVNQIQASAIEVIDSLCPPPAPTPLPGDQGFLQGLIDGAPIDKQDVLTVKQNEDLQRLMRLCALPKEQRPLYEYGFLTSRGVSGLFGLALKGITLLK